MKLQLKFQKEVFPYILVLIDNIEMFFFIFNHQMRYGMRFNARVLLILQKRVRRFHVKNYSVECIWVFCFVGLTNLRTLTNQFFCSQIDGMTNDFSIIHESFLNDLLKTDEKIAFVHANWHFGYKQNWWNSIF